MNARDRVQSRAGFTLVELITTVAILALLAAISIPKMQQFRLRAEAADMVSRMLVIRNSAFNAMAATGEWPESGGWGEAPAAMESYLPGGFAFTRGDVQFMWTSVPAAPGQEASQIVWLYTTNGLMCQAVEGLLGGAGNSALASACAPAGGTVALYVESSATS